MGGREDDLIVLMNLVDDGQLRLLIARHGALQTMAANVVRAGAGRYPTRSVTALGAIVADLAERHRREEEERRRAAEEEFLRSTRERLRELCVPVEAVDAFVEADPGCRSRTPQGFLRALVRFCINSSRHDALVALAAHPDEPDAAFEAFAALPPRRRFRILPVASRTP